MKVPLVTKLRNGILPLIAEALDLTALEYPFDIPSLLRKRRAFRRTLLELAPSLEIKVAILGGSTTDDLASLLELFLLKQGIRPSFYQSPYGRYYEDAVLDSAALKSFSPNLVLIHTSSRNLLHLPPLFASNDDVEACLDREIARFEAVWNGIREHCGCVIIQNNFELLPQRLLGNLDSVAPFGATNFINRLNRALAQRSNARSDLIVNDINYLSTVIGLDQWHDAAQWFSYKIAVSPTANVFLAHNLGRIIGSVYGRSRKCLVLDLDHTLWGGVIGDDGVDKLRLGNETPEGEAYSGFQRYCLELKKRGVLLAVCSKNDPEIAEQGFSHRDSILQLSDFAAFRANWEPKHENILAIARELNIGLESLVFVDDNPAERALVAAQLPTVAVPDIGDQVSEFAVRIDRAGFFEAPRLSKEDSQRAAYYGQNSERTAAAAAFVSYDEFLASLEMVAEIDTFRPVYLDRITQLTNKTNQFNLTTRRYTLAEIEQIARDPAQIGLYGRLRDRFGDNGLISAIIGTIKAEELHVDLWLMSCRVLKREMEMAMLDELVEKARTMNVRSIIGYYRRSSRNMLVADHYEKLGFSCVSNDPDTGSIWKLDISNGYQPRNRFIRSTGYE